MRTTSILVICTSFIVLVSSHSLKKKHPLLHHKFKGHLGGGLVAGGLLGAGFKPYGLPFAGLPIQKVPDQPVAGQADAVAVNAASPTANVAQIAPQNIPLYSDSIDSFFAGSVPYQFYEEDGQGRQGQLQFGVGNRQGLPIPIALTLGGYNPTESSPDQSNGGKSPETVVNNEPSKENKTEKQQILLFPQNQLPNQLGLLQLLQQLGQVVMIVPGQMPVQPVFPVQTFAQPQQQQQQQNGFGQQQQQQQNFGSRQPYQPQGFYSTGAFLPGNSPYFGGNVYLQPQPIQGEDEVPLAHSGSTSTSTPSNPNVAQAYVVQPLKTRDQKPVTKTKKGREESDLEESPASV